MQETRTEADFYDALLQYEESKIEGLEFEKHLDGHTSTQKTLRTEIDGAEKEIREIKQRQLEIKLGTGNTSSFQVFSFKQPEDGSNEHELKKLQAREDDLVEHLELLRKEKAAIDNLLEEERQNMKSLEQRRERAQALLRNQHHLSSMERKKAILRMAKESDPNATACAENLGKLLLRAPEHYMQHFCEDLAEPRPAHVEAELALGRRQQEVQTITDIMRKPGWGSLLDDVVKLRFFVDEKARLAENQDQKAILELLAMMCDFRIPLIIREHMETVTKHALVEVETLDKQNVGTMQDSPIPYGSLCPVTAYMPNEGFTRQESDASFANRDVLMAGGYSELTRYINARIDEYVKQQQDPEMRAKRARNRSGRKPDEVSIDALITQHAKLGVLVEKNPELFEQRPEEAFRIAKAVSERTFFKAKKTDPLLHVSAVVEEVLRRHIAQVLQEVKVLWHQVKDKESHWYMKRESVRRATELARRGSTKALDLLLKASKEETHWVLKQIMATETMWLLKFLPLETAKIVLEHVVPYIFLFALESASPEEKKMADMIRQTAKTAFLQQFPDWPDTVKDMARDKCVSYVDRQEKSEARRAELDDIRSKMQDYWEVPPPRKDNTLWRLRHQLAEEAQMKDDAVRQEFDR
mmetsp:Transcript_49527/g.115871  ORF Transcript_49527/g.115871 Transcript_49527/m.115871 type:complete len:640 (+) Transcript_49527:82-2001(+)